MIGQAQGSHEHLKVAQQYFQLVGNSPSECDTIPGRQCLASAYFVMKQFNDVLTYLDSIKVSFNRFPMTRPTFTTSVRLI